VSVLVVAQSSSEIPEGLMNNPVCVCVYIYIFIFYFFLRKKHCALHFNSG